VSSVNGVHALLAFLVQQAQPAKQSGDVKLDVKQLQQLLQEYRLLNERLLNIERLITVSHSPRSEKVERQRIIVSKVEGNWPAAGLVRDTINQQERQQAFGTWRAEDLVDFEKEPFNYHATEVERDLELAEVKQLLIQRYVPSDSDLTRAEMSVNYGAHKANLDFPLNGNDEFDLNGSNEDRGRLLMIAIGLGLLLFTLCAAIS
jgi:hypothetical protein